MEIHTHSFCGISKSKDWQTFLLETEPSLHKDLMRTLESRQGCRTNTRKMKEIYVKLYERGHGPAFETFVSRRFPWLIKSQAPADPKKITPDPPRKPPITQIKSRVDTAKLNKHQVFKRYRPNLLTFPQQLIIVDPNPNSLQRKIQQFCRDKLAVDWIVIEDRAYIEYFHPKYAEAVNKIPRERREIYQYRQRLNQNG